MYSVLFNIKLILLIMWDLLLSTEENIVQTLFEVGENVEIASGRKWYPGNVLKKDIRNGVEMVQVEYSTLFQDKNKKIKRLQESVYSDRIRPQPPSEKPEETKSLELMDNVEAYHNDGWCNARRVCFVNMMRDSIPELLALPKLKHPVGSEPKPKVTILSSQKSLTESEGRLWDLSHWMDHTHLHCLNRLRLRFILEFVVQRLKGPWNLGDIILSENYDMNMMRDSIPELLALPELKYPIGSEPKLKEPLDGSHASPLSQQVETQVEKEPSNQAHAAQTQFFSTNVTQQVKSSEKLVLNMFWNEPLNESHLHLHCLNRLKLRFILLTRHNTSNVWKLLYIFMMAFLIFCRLRKSN
ncbi:unnamed protein product [Brassica oleracea var. botrytis]|uniref:(rape) hypothetical protein n=1 Tax=Brassica napus TaxID=3708 RepID=A0A816KEJ2_BRANA|nr:unnamed protein product [Brassica napus]